MVLDDIMIPPLPPLKPNRRRRLETAIRDAMRRSLPDGHPTIDAFWSRRMTYTDRQICDMAEIHGVPHGD